MPDDLIADMVRAATRAPSAHNRQPWRFHVVRDTDGKARLAKAMGDRLRADRSRDGDDAQAIEQDVARSSGRINGAGALIAVCLTLDEMDVYPDAKRQRGRIYHGSAEHGDGFTGHAAQGAVCRSGRLLGLRTTIPALTRCAMRSTCRKLGSLKA